MGSCFTQDNQKSIRNIDNDLTQTKLDYQFLQIPTDVLLRSRGKETTPAINLDVSQNISTLKDRLMDQEKLEVEQWQKLHSTTSSVILKGQNKNRTESKNPNEKCPALTSLVSELRVNENIDGSIVHQNDYQKLKIGTDLANIEFLLPRCRGGPLVVPYLLYQNYCPI